MQCRDTPHLSEVRLPISDWITDDLCTVLDPESCIIAIYSLQTPDHFRLSSCLLSVCTRDTSITPGRGYSSGKVTTKTQVRNSFEHAKLVTAKHTTDSLSIHVWILPEARESDTCLRCLSRAGWALWCYWLSSLVLLQHISIAFIFRRCSHSVTSKGWN